MSAISEESKSMLENQVKKGKARKFILICKGATIISLIVFKKGPYGPKVNKARKEGLRGEAVCGVVTGKGVNLDFQLPGNSDVSMAMKAEGNVCESEPCTIPKLRKFFAEEADLKFKPAFTIVRQLGELASVDESDDESDVDQTAATPTASAEASQETGTQVSPEEERQKLVEALKKLTPKIQEAVKAQPQRRDELLDPIASIKEHLQYDRLTEAREEIVAYPSLLKSLLGGTETPPAAPPTPPATGAEDDKTRFLTRLKAIKPEFDQVIQAQLPLSNEVQQKAAEAGGLARDGDFGQANQALDQVEQLVQQGLSQIAAETPAAAAATDDPTSAFKLRVEALIPQIKQGIGTPAGDEAKLKVSQASAFARKENFADANRLLDEIDSLLSSPETVSPASETWKAARAEWESATETIGSQLSQLETKFRASGHPLLMRVAEFGLGGITGTFKVGLQTAMFEFEQAGGDKRPQAQKKLLEGIKGFQSLVSSNEAIQLLDENELNATVTIRQTLGSALANMAKSLNSAS